MNANRGLEKFLDLLVVLCIAFYPFYLPVRFLTGWIYQIPFVITALILIVFFMKLLLARISFVKLNKLEFLVLLFLSYSLILSLLPPWSVMDSLDNIRVYVIPGLVFFIFSNIRYRYCTLVLTLLIAGGLLVSIFYLIELYGVVISHKGLMLWTQIYQSHAADEGYRVSLSRSMVSGVYYLRLPGFIGHNHATGFFMGITSSICLIHYFTEAIGRKKILYLLSFTLCFLAMLFSFARTSILSIVIADLFIFFIFMRHNIKLIFLFVFLFSLTLFVLYCLFPEASFFASATDTFFSSSSAEKFSGGMQRAYNNNTLHYIQDLMLFPPGLLIGFGFSEAVVSDDIFSITLLARYGVLGFIIYFSMIGYGIFWAYKMLKKNINDRILMSSFVYILAITLTISHSGTSFKIQLVTFTYAFLGMVSREYNARKPSTS